MPSGRPNEKSRSTDNRAETRDVGYLTRRAFLRGMGLATVCLTCGSELLADGPPIVTQNRLIDEDHVFITSARHDHYLARVVTAREILGKTFATTGEILDATGAFVCFNGSFFEADGSPSGLFVCGGLQKNPVTYGKGDGILYIDRSRRIHIISKFHYAEHKENFVDAIQINLMTEGELKMYEDKTYKKLVPRNFIGTTPEGIVDVIYKNTNLTYGDRYMRQTHNCTAVGALDGGGSASAVDRLGKSSYKEGRRDRREAAVPNFIVLYEK